MSMSNNGIKELLQSIEKLKKSQIKKVIDARIREFKENGRKSSNEIFKELCFCILTAYFNAERSIKIQEELGDGVQWMFALVSEHPLWASSASAPSGFMGSKSLVLTPFRVTPQAPHHIALSVLYCHHIQVLPQYSQMITKYLTVSEGFLTLQEFLLARKLKELGHRFPETRAKYIVKARKYKDSLKDIINSFDDENKLREWLVKNIKGIGYKEASHFLRNIGYTNFAIIDFHIIDILARYKLIKKPKETVLFDENL